MQLVLLAVGWSARAGRAIGYAFASHEGFRPMATEGGHTLCPFPSADDPDYDGLFDLFEPAKSGTGIEAFHLELARNQVRGFRPGP